MGAVLTGLLIATAVALVLVLMYGVHRLERWSQDCEARADARRAARARDLIASHTGAAEDYAAQLRKWLDAGQGSAVAR